MSAGLCIDCGVVAASGAKMMAVRWLNEELRLSHDCEAALSQLSALHKTVVRRQDDLDAQLNSHDGHDASVLKCQTASLLTRCKSARDETDTSLHNFESLRPQCSKFLRRHFELASEAESVLTDEERRMKQRCYGHQLKGLREDSKQMQMLTSTGRDVDHQSVIDTFQEMWSRHSTLITRSECVNLALYGRQLLAAWRRRLQQPLVSQLEMILTEQLHYPFISTSLSSEQRTPLSPTSDYRLAQLVRLLTRLEMCCVSGSDTSDQPLLPTATLIVQVLVKPLQRRFIFHFCGEKVTNRLDRPEWYLGQVLQWFTSHDRFLSNRIQPAVSQVAGNETKWQVRLQFFGALLSLAAGKLDNDLSQLGGCAGSSDSCDASATRPATACDDDVGDVCSSSNDDLDALFSHTVDEVLRTERRVASMLSMLDDESVPSRVASPLLLVLCRRPHLDRWLHVEARFARLRMDQLFAGDQHAWRTCVTAQPHTTSDRGSSAHETTATTPLVTQAGEAVCSLLGAMTARLSQLPQLTHRLRFVYLQVELIDELRVRLCQLLATSHAQPLSVVSCGVVNTAHHVRHTLLEWSEHPLFLQLQCLSVRQSEHCQQPTGGDDVEVLDIVLDEREQEIGGSVKLKEDQVSSDASPHLSDLAYTVFDGSMQMLARIETEFIELTVGKVMSECRAVVWPYCQDNWFNKPPLSDFISPSLSPHACQFVQVLSQCLQQLNSQLDWRLYATLHLQLCQQLSQLLLTRLLLANSFSAGGAQQVQFDIERCMCAVLFCYHKNDGQHVSVGCRQGVAPLLDACRLLTIPLGGAVAARDQLLAAGGRPSTTSSCLRTLHVRALSWRQVVDVLQTRLDLLTITK